MRDLIKQVLDEIRGAWRFRRVALATAWAVCLAGWLVVLILPNQYEATARVFVDPSTSLRPVIKDLAVEQDVNAELNLVRQTLLSGAQLTKVVDATGLALNAATVEKKQQVIDALRYRISITVQSSSPPGTEPSTQNPSKIYTLSYQDSNRERALKVVDLMLTAFVEGTLGGKRAGAQQAQRFLEDQIKEYERRLAEAEERLAEFKKNNMGMVPGDHQGDYFTRLQTEMDAVKKAQSALNLALTRHETMEKQLRGEAPIAASSGTYSTPGVGTAQNGGDSLSRIKETQAKLDELLLRFTDKHPEVIATRGTLEELKARRNAEVEALKRGDPNAAALTGASSNPVYQSIQLALNQTGVEIASIRSELSDHQQKVADLRRFVDTMPQVEAEYARLNRDYTVTRGQYTALAERLEKARVGEGADATGSVRFEVIDPPNSPFIPVSPQRFLLLAGVLIVGLAVGVGVSYLLNLLNPVFYTAMSLAQATGIPVLGAVSLTRSEGENRELLHTYRRYAILTSLLLVIFVGVVIAGRKFAPLAIHL